MVSASKKGVFGEGKGGGFFFVMATRLGVTSLAGERCQRDTHNRYTISKRHGMVVGQSTASDGSYCFLHLHLKYIFIWCENLGGEEATEI